MECHGVFASAVSSPGADRDGFLDRDGFFYALSELYARNMSVGCIPGRATLPSDQAQRGEVGAYVDQNRDGNKQGGAPRLKKDVHVQQCMIRHGFALSCCTHATMRQFRFGFESSS